MQRFISKRHLRFIIVNLLFVSFFIVILFLLNNGTGNETPYYQIITSILISIPIVILQYPILNWKKNWFYKILIFYLSMVSFLFILGIIMAWNEQVGSNEAGTWLARFDSGFRMVIFGQIFGGIFSFIPMLMVNFILREVLFEEKNIK
ncbi:MAG: hypothetical protein H6587_12240 [Flavobacteriales bacterium]|nr:hypothetical protein [Flavobacteriales bacterium]